MEEKFDEEFKKKVKQIDSEVPDVVKSRINDTLASLPAKRNYKKLGYLSAVAALFLVCFVGIKYMLPTSLKKNSASQEIQRFTAQAEDSADNENDQQLNASAVENDSEDSQEANTSDNSTKVSLKANLSNKPADSVTKSEESVAAPDETARAAVDTTKVEMSLKSIQEQQTVEDQGIELILKTALYDGNEIRVEFDKVLTGSSPSVYGTEQANEETSDSKSDETENYTVRITVNSIPLKCSINIIETPSEENHKSGTMIIIPESGLPDNFDITLNFDKIGEVSGKWLLTTHVTKQ